MPEQMQTPQTIDEAIALAARQGIVLSVEDIAEANASNWRPKHNKLSGVPCGNGSTMLCRMSCKGYSMSGA
jgi:hypothetical protein